MTGRNSISNQDLIETAHALADAARVSILPWFRKAGLSASNKAAEGFDPVTQADRAAEEAMRAVLAERRPADAILGEEFGRSEGSSGITWVLDPIDGTRAFLSGTPTWGVLIAASDDNGPFLGIIDQPYTQERFVGGPGVAGMDRAAWRRGAGDAGDRQPVRGDPLHHLPRRRLCPRGRGLPPCGRSGEGWCATAWIATPTRSWRRGRSTS